MRTPSPWPLTLALTLLLSAGCRRTAPAGSDRDPVLARIDGEELRAHDLDAALGEMGLRGPQPLTTRKQVLEQLIQRRALVAEARRLELDRSPAVRARIESALVQELNANYAKTHELRAAESSVSLEEARKFYEAHKAEYQQPARVRVAHLLVATEGKPQAQAKATAQKLLAQIKEEEKQGKEFAFLLLCQTRSDDLSTRALGGDLRYQSREELARLVGEPAAQAAFALPVKGEAGPLLGPRGFELLRVLDKQAPLDQRFEDPAVQEQVRRRIASERWSQERDGYLRGLREKAKVTVDERALTATEGQK